MGVDTRPIAFSEKFSGCMGTLIINGLTLPRANGFDPLVKIWTTVRKYVFSKAGLDVVGIFAHDVEQELIVCSFYLSYRDATDPEEVKALTERFGKSFPRQMKIFEDTLIKFLKDEDGYDTYVELIKANAEASFTEVFNNFLKKAGVRTEKVEKLAEEAENNRNGRNKGKKSKSNKPQK